MIMRRHRPFLRDERGATLVETTIVFALLLTLTFGLVELGVMFWEYHAAEKATAMGARWLATRHGVAGNAALPTELYTTQVPDCFVATAQPLGTPCSQVAGATGWSVTCSGAGGGACSSAQMSALLGQMQQFAPSLTAANVSVTLSGTGMGFVGRGRAVPLVTVKTTGLTYTFVTGALLGLNSITMPSFATTLPAEDQKEGTGV